MYSNNIGNIHPKGRLSIIAPTPKYLILCNELHEFQCVMITNVLVKLSMIMCMGNKPKVLALLNKYQSLRLLRHMLYIFIVCPFDMK